MPGKEIIRGIAFRNEVLRAIFARHIRADFDQGCAFYRPNFQALDYAQKKLPVDASFVAAILDHPYGDLKHTQRGVIAENADSLYAFLEFAKNKDNSLFKEILFCASKEKGLQATTPTAETVYTAIIDSGEITNRLHTPLILDVMHNKEKAEMVLKSLSSDPQYLTKLVDYVVPQCDNKTGFLFIASALKALDNVSDKKLKLATQQDIQAVIGKNLYSDVLFAMDAGISACKKSSTLIGKDRKVEELIQLKNKYLDDPSDENLRGFLLRSANTRTVFGRKDKLSDTGSLTAFYKHLSPESRTQLNTSLRKEHTHPDKASPDLKGIKKELTDLRKHLESEVISAPTPKK